MSLAFAAGAVEVVLLLAGCVVYWRLVLSPRARRERHPARLARWEVSTSEFLLFLLLVVCGGIGSQFLCASLIRHSPFDSDGRMLVGAVIFQLGMLAGIAAFQLVSSDRRRGFELGSASVSGAFASGVLTFLIALPAITAVGGIWQLILTHFGLPVEQQDLIGFFLNTNSNFLRCLIVIFAIGVAPVTEELIFRRGLFRYFRGRMPRWVALWLPALLFGCLHVNWTSLAGFGVLAQLAVLGLIFSLAYERTGNIGTSIVAHSLFNLNMVVLILSGADF